MLIGNRLNPNHVINTDLVTDYWKGQRPDYAKPFTINFGFAAGTSEDAICAVWEFEKEEDRDAQWNNLMGAIGVEYFEYL